jgi:hypothetical protein
MDVRRGFGAEASRNAYLLAQGRTDLTYVEGFACRIIPCWHAWCVTKDGIVVDPTWRYAKNEINLYNDYFGIPFKLDFVSKMIVKTKMYGILYNREILEATPAEFMETL